MDKYDSIGLPLVYKFCRLEEVDPNYFRFLFVQYLLSAVLFLSWQKFVNFLDLSRVASTRAFGSRLRSLIN